MADRVANGIECSDCGHIGFTTFLNDCPMDAGEGEPHWVTPVFIEDCPKGVTRGDWLAGKATGCDSEFHNWSSGQHVEMVDLP